LGMLSMVCILRVQGNIIVPSYRRRPYTLGCVKQNVVQYDTFSGSGVSQQQHINTIRLAAVNRGKQITNNTRLDPEFPAFMEQ
jgi:hypothetical protein